MGFGGWIGGLIIPPKSRGVEVNRIHGDWPGAAGSGGRWHPPGEPEQRRSAGALEGAPGSGPESGQIRRDRPRWELVNLNGVDVPERPRGGTAGRIHPAREAGTGQNLLTSTALRIQRARERPRLLSFFPVYRFISFKF